jgi:hypothetical protein
VIVHDNVLGHDTLHPIEWVPTKLLSDLAEHNRAETPKAPRSGEETEVLITQLADSMRTAGMWEPVMIKIGGNGRAIISEHNHRIVAAIRAGISHLPAYVLFLDKCVDSGAKDLFSITTYVHDITGGNFFAPSRALGANSQCISLKDMTRHRDQVLKDIRSASPNRNNPTHPTVSHGHINMPFTGSTNRGTCCREKPVRGSGRGVLRSSEDRVRHR